MTPIATKASSEVIVVLYHEQNPFRFSNRFCSPKTEARPQASEASKEDCIYACALHRWWNSNMSVITLDRNSEHFSQEIIKSSACVQVEREELS